MYSYTLDLFIIFFQLFQYIMLQTGTVFLIIYMYSNFSTIRLKKQFPTFIIGAKYIIFYKPSIYHYLLGEFYVKYN